MADVVDKVTRSRMMSGIKGRDTRPELVVRRALHAAGFRYRLHAADLPGRPDIVLPRHRVVILVHGCFWHRHAGCRFATTPATRTDFWAQKFERNLERDIRNRQALRAEGWRIATLWECSLRRFDLGRVSGLVGWIRSNGPDYEDPATPSL
jgi:DNA mismatch endonuclease (patch repair protein)